MPTAPRAGRSADGGNLGTNVGGVQYWDGVIPFANLMDQAGDWIPQAEGAAWGKGPALTFDRHGWPVRLRPGQFASAVLADVTYPAGRYRVRWSGTGTFDINGTPFGGTGGSGTVELDGTSTVVLNLRTTDASDPIRAIEVRLPGEPDDAVFRSRYVESLRLYRALRFMDWQRTNTYPGDPDRRFGCDRRVDASHYSQGSSLGASVERMVDLANAVGADPWFTVPHEASDDWITCHARVVAERLAPALTPRYEFSNETWNPAFRAYHDLAEQSARSGRGGDEFERIQIRTGERHTAVMRVVGAVFRAAGRPLTRVLAGQAANAWVVETRLGASGTRDLTDEIAIAPYLTLPGNPMESAEARALARRSPDAILAALDSALDNDVATWITEHVALAGRTGLRLVAYEGGQHLVGDPNNDGLTELFTTVNRSPGMGERYRRYLTRWAQATGNALFMHFTDVGPPSRYGAWGASESWNANSSPKLEALVAFATTRPG